jgi:hypothetical protein
MEFGPVDAKADSDRFSTSDEVLVALFSLRDILVQSSRDTLWEVDSDNGIKGCEVAGAAELLRALEKLDGTIN